MARKHVIEGSTLAFKPRAHITRSSKKGIGDLTKEYLRPQNVF